MAFDSTEVAWRDLEVFVNGVSVGKVTAIKEMNETEVEEIYGAGDEPVDIQTGNRKYGVQATFYKSVIDNMNSAAKAAGGRDLMDIPWVIVAGYKPTIQSPRQTRTYTNVRFQGYEVGMEQNAKSMPIALTARCFRPEVV